MQSDTPFRRFIRQGVYEDARRAIEENVRRHLHRGVELYDTMLKDRLDHASDQCVVLAVCADKPERLRGQYYERFRNFAEKQKGDKHTVVVCRLFLSRGGFSAALQEDFKLHEDWGRFGVVPLTVEVAGLESLEALALARANARDLFGLVLFLDPDGSFALTHAGGKPEDFWFSEWRQPANVRQFIRLFDSLLVRSKEFRHAVETQSDLLGPLRQLRSRIRAAKARRRTVVGWPSADEVLEATQPTGWPGVHVLASFARQSTFYQTQVRALNLAWALLQGREKPTRIAVVGDGIGGLTFAAACVKQGVPVDLFGNSGQTYLRWQYTSCRYLHPHIYEWPHAGWDNADADLPVLPWKAGPAQDVAKKIVNEFKATYRPGLKGDHRWGPAVSAESGQYVLKKASSHGSEVAGPFDVVVFAVGLGTEVHPWKGVTRPYWDEQPRPPIDPAKKILVAGNGDGGLVDLAACSIEGYDQATLTDKLSDACLTRPAILKGIQDLERNLQEIGPAARHLDLWKAYDSWLARLISGEGTLLRSGLNIDFCPGHAGVFRADTSALNRYVAYLILKGIRFAPDARRVVNVQHHNDGWQATFSDGKAVSYERVVLRFGTGRPRRETIPDEWQHNKAIYQDCAHMWEEDRIDLMSQLNPAAQDFFAQKRSGT